MLQPQQLEEVSVRYAGKIAELREFLWKAGLPVGTAEAVGNMAARVSRDRAFCRDLTLHLCVVAHGGDRQIGYPDLLGILAVAAAGTRLAGEAETADAHLLLCFVMEARPALDAALGQPAEANGPFRVETAAVPFVPSALPTPRHAEPAFDEPLQPSHRNIPFRESPPHHRAGRQPLAWIAAGSVLVALLIGLWLHRREAPVGVSSQAPIVTGKQASDVSSGAVKAGGTPASLPGGDTATATSAERSTELGTLPVSRDVPRRPAAPVSRDAYPTAPSSSLARTTMDSRSAAGAEPRLRSSTNPTAILPSAASPALPAAAPSASATARSAVKASSPLIPHATSASIPVVAPIPVSTLSTRLGARTIPAYAWAQDGDSKYPRLLRRRTSPSSSEGLAGTSNLLAEVEPADRPVLPASGYTSFGHPASTGIVRPIFLGRMAANVLYSPSPAYPPAASAARVQGEVTVQAEVGRDGSVLAARVVSGPPLLRDAALDAVQRWRYRPYLSAGKPVPVSAVAVMEFELP